VLGCKYKQRSQATADQENTALIYLLYHKGHANVVTLIGAEKVRSQPMRNLLVPRFHNALKPLLKLSIELRYDEYDGLVICYKLVLLESCRLG